MALLSPARWGWRWSNSSTLGRTPDFHCFREASIKELGAAAAVEDVERELGFPLVVKPARQGSALGVKFARSSEQPAETFRHGGDGAASYPHRNQSHGTRKWFALWSCPWFLENR